VKLHKEDKSHYFNLPLTFSPFSWIDHVRNSYEQVSNVSLKSKINQAALSDILAPIKLVDYGKRTINR